MILSQVARVTVVSWLCACACVSKPLDDPSVPHAPATPAEFVQQFAERVCSGFDKCCGEQGFAFDASTCPDAITAEIEPEITATDGLQVDWDPEAAARCIQDYADAVCGDHQVPDLKRNCSVMFRGRVAAADPCAADAECRALPGETAHCDLGLTNLCVVQTPPARGKPADACNGTCIRDDGGTCRDGLYNQNTAPGAETLPLCHKSDGLQCSPDAKRAWLCQPLVDIGQSCADNPGACVAAAFCNVDTNLCEEQWPVGTPSCSHFDKACQPPAVCDFAIDECIALIPSGLSCHSSSSNCQSGYCNADGICSRPELRASLCADPGVLSGG